MPPTSGGRSRNDGRKGEYGALDLLLVRREEGWLSKKKREEGRGDIWNAPPIGQRRKERRAGEIHQRFKKETSHINICISVPAYVYAVPIYKREDICDFSPGQWRSSCSSSKRWRRGWLIGIKPITQKRRRRTFRLSAGKRRPSFRESWREKRGSSAELEIRQRIKDYKKIKGKLSPVFCGKWTFFCFL